MTRKSASQRRGLGRVERLTSGRCRAAYTGPDGRLYRAPETFTAKDDAIAWLTTRRQIRACLLTRDWARLSA